MCIFCASTSMMCINFVLQSLSRADRAALALRTQNLHARYSQPICGSREEGSTEEPQRSFHNAVELIFTPLCLSYVQRLSSDCLTYLKPHHNCETCLPSSIPFLHLPPFFPLVIVVVIVIIIIIITHTLSTSLSFLLFFPFSPSSQSGGIR